MREEEGGKLTGNLRTRGLALLFQGADTQILNGSPLGAGVHLSWRDMSPRKQNLRQGLQQRVYNPT